MSGKIELPDDIPETLHWQAELEDGCAENLKEAERLDRADVGFEEIASGDVWCHARGAGGEYQIRRHSVGDRYRRDDDGVDVLRMVPATAAEQARGIWALGEFVARDVKSFDEAKAIAERDNHERQR
jgi:hypothetical protein